MRRFIAKLNKAVLPFAVAVALILCMVSPVTASAAWDDPYDYVTMPYSVEYGTEYNYVYFTWDARYAFWTICKTTEPNVIVGRSLNSGRIDFTFEAGVSYIIRFYPFGRNGLLLDHIPDGTSIGFSSFFDVTSGSDSLFDSIPNVTVYGWLKNRNNSTSPREIYESFSLDSVSDVFTTVMTVDSDILFSKVAEDENAIYDKFVPMIAVDHFTASFANNRDVTFRYAPTTLVMKVPTDYWIQFQNEILLGKLESLGGDFSGGSFEELSGDIADGFEGLSNELTEEVDDLKSYISAENILSRDVFVGNINRVSGEIISEVQSSKQQILSAINNSNNVIMQGTDQMNNTAQDALDKVGSSADSLDLLGDQLAAVDKPNVDDIPVSPEDLVTDPNAGAILTGAITSLWDNPVIFGILTTVLTLVLLSWVFFGKK